MIMMDLELINSDLAVINEALNLLLPIYDHVIFALFGGFAGSLLLAIFLFVNAGGRIMSRSGIALILGIITCLANMGYMYISRYKEPERAEKTIFFLSNSKLSSKQFSSFKQYVVNDQRNSLFDVLNSSLMRSATGSFSSVRTTGFTGAATGSTT
jgi:hypothetical protein